MGGELFPGDIVAGRYRIVRPIGAGGMGAVYEAEQIALGRKVALKVVFDDDAEALARFEREARALARIDHPAVVRVIDFLNDADGRAVIIMDLLDGESLHARIRREKRLSIAQTITVTTAILSGLAAIHAAGIVHRDLKPSNILLTKDGAKIVDFGIVRVRGAPKLTAPDAVVGTPSYLAPEQLKGEPVDARTDLHAVGACMYEMLTGERLWKARAGPELLAEILSDQPKPLRERRADVPAEVAMVVHRALAKEPSARFTDASSMVRALTKPLMADTMIGMSPADTMFAGPRPSQPTATSPRGLGPPGPPLIPRREPPTGLEALLLDPQRQLFFIVVLGIIALVVLKNCSVAHPGVQLLK